jgi:hypothetical protein
LQHSKPPKQHFRPQGTPPNRQLFSGGVGGLLPGGVKGGNSVQTPPSRQVKFAGQQVLPQQRSLAAQQFPPQNRPAGQQPSREFGAS